MRAKDAVGRYGEQVAAQRLTEAGLTVLERNWRCEHGEIDIVAREARTLVICEVKTRRGSAYGTPFEAITAAKARRLRRLAGCWMRERGVHPAEVRFDVVGVLCGPRGAAEVEHRRGVL